MKTREMRPVPDVDRLPDSFIQFTVGGIREGMSTYVVPEVMVVDKNRRCWLAADHAVQDYSPKQGTARLHITRVNGGFAVVLPPDYRWEITGVPPGRFIPVVALFAP